MGKHLDLSNVGTVWPGAAGGVVCLYDAFTWCESLCGHLRLAVEHGRIFKILFMVSLAVDAALVRGGSQCKYSCLWI